MDLFIRIWLFIIGLQLTNSIKMEYKNNGNYKIPVLGIGTFLITEREELTNALNSALEIGYRHIDTSAVYKNEHLIGEVLKNWISSGKVKREDLFITTRLAQTDMYKDYVETALKTSLEKLQLDYVDAWLIQNPIRTKIENGTEVTLPTDHISVWKKMEEQVDAGRARTIGLSNFNISQIQRIQRIARIQPANIQIEAHVYFQQQKLREFCYKNNLTVVAYGPLGNPGLTEYLQKSNAFNVGISENRKNAHILTDETIQKIAKKHKKTNAQIALKYLLQLGFVTIPKSVHPERQRENIDIFDFTLSKHDMSVLATLERGKAGRLADIKDIIEGVENHPEYPYHDY